METFREVEDKYDVGPDFVVPLLAGVGDIASVDEPRTDELVAIYYDTPDFRLARNKVILRRRRGGSDSGWHLKLPAGSARTEIHRPLGRGERVPPAFSDLVFARTRGAALLPVVRLSTSRTTYALRDAGGNVLAELADDRVHAEVFAAEGHDVELSAWREIEVELADGNGKLLRQARRRLVQAGAELSARPSKFAGVLGDRVASGPEVSAPVPSLDLHSASRAVIAAYLSEQAERLMAADLRVRLDEPESIHDMRVASRRIRSTLKTFRRLFAADDARRLEERLRDVGVRLGVARDSEVLLSRLLGLLDELPETFIVGPVRRRLHEQLHGEYLRSRSEALAFMGSREYGELLDELITFVRDGFAGDLGESPANKVLPKLVRRSSRKLVRRVAAADAARTGAEREHALHQARKAAKQARYAAEAVEPAFGRQASRLAKHAKEIQQILGEHQDSVVAAEVLHRMGVAAHGQADESSFTFGLLAGLERAYAADARRRFDVVWSKGLAEELLRSLD